MESICNAQVVSVIPIVQQSVESRSSLPWLDTVIRQDYNLASCGYSSVVERHLPKVNVWGSSPHTRSRKRRTIEIVRLLYLSGGWKIGAVFLRANGSVFAHRTAVSDSAGNLSIHWEERAGKMTVPANTAALRIDGAPYSQRHYSDSWCLMDPATLVINSGTGSMTMK
jgi:hypothetical protein